MEDNIKTEISKSLKLGLFTSILVALGPVLWLIFNISQKRYEELPLNIAFAVLSVAVVLFNLRMYLKERRRGSGAIKGFLRLVVDFLFYIALIVSFVILFIAFYAAIAFIQEKLFVKEGYMTYMIKSPYSYLIFLIIILVCGKISFLLSKGKKGEKSILPGKYLLIILIALVYIVITSVVVVTEEGIYDYSFYNLKGEVYKFSDVKVVNTGFKEKGRNKGEFFYNIQLNSGKTFKLAFPSMTQPGKQYTNDTWQEYVDIDEIIMNTGAKKISSEKGSQHVMMDKIYIDKLLKVVRNK